MVVCNAMQAEMIGSDVVIAGMVGEQCFAYSYYLTAKEQCNYEGGQVHSQFDTPHFNKNSYMKDVC